MLGTAPFYSPSGHILFRQEDELWAVPFEIDSFELTGKAVVILDEVAYGPRLARDGTLAYVAERRDGNARLVWVDRNGASAPIPGERHNYTHIDLSHDGRYALLNVDGGVYASDLARASRSLVTSSGGFPIWDPKGRRATFLGDGAVLRRAFRMSSRLPIKTPVL